MKIDKYTKFILTIIALCLVWICVRDVCSTPGALAAPAPSLSSSSPTAPAQEIVITGVKIPLRDDAGNQLMDINGKPMFTWALPVQQRGR